MLLTKAIHMLMIASSSLKNKCILMKTRLSILFLLFFIQFVKAQDAYQVTGKVIEKGTKLPLPGVSILIKGSKSGTTTDQLGNFKLKLNNVQETLTFSFLGFASQDISANSV
jgi:hypothetical protein